MEKSDIDRAKEDQEEQCFVEAIKAGRRKKTRTKNIVNYLDGAQVEREKQDRPDIIRKCKHGKKNITYSIVGIEHFIVDALSKTKGSKMVSYGMESLHHIKNIYEKGHDELEKTGSPSEESMDKMMGQTTLLVKDVFNTPYLSFVEAFKYNLEHHIRRVDEYKRRLKDVANGYPIEVAFLIEMRAEWNHIYFIDNKKATQNINGTIPMFEDVVAILETIDPTQVKFVILMLKNMVYDDVKDVIAFRTGDIRKNLAQQNVKICKFISDKTQTEKISIEKSREKNGNYTLTSSFTHNKKDEKIFIDTMVIWEEIENAAKKDYQVVISERDYNYLKALGLMS